MKKFLFSIILAVLLIAFPAGAEFFSDVIVTSPNGIWTDSRAYSSLPAAINAVGSLQRTIVVVSQQSVGNITVPSNVTLKFERDGAIIHFGQLTFNTKNIIAENRQIFAGAGDIDFAVGSVVKSGWFSNLDKALDVTNDDTLTMVISKAETTTADMVVGDNVTLRWESPFIITAAVGHTVSNIKNIEAGNYQIFAGAGDFDFLDGTELYLKWFVRLRSVLTWIENEEVTIVVNEDSTVSYDNTVASNENIKILPGGKLNIDVGRTITLNSQIVAGDYQIISDTGTITFASGSKVKSAWFSSFEVAVTKISTANVELEISSASAIANDCTVDANTTLSIPSKGRILTVANTKTLTINGPFEHGLSQCFSGTGSVNGFHKAYPEWWGDVSDTTVQKACDSITNAGVFPHTGGIVYITSGTWTPEGITLPTYVNILDLSSGYPLLYLGDGGSEFRLVGAGNGNPAYTTTNTRKEGDRASSFVFRNGNVGSPRNSWQWTSGLHGSVTAGIYEDNLMLYSWQGLLYDTGTVSVVNDSATVTGVGTAWTVDGKTHLQANFRVGDVQEVVKSVESATSLTLESVWSGATLGGQNYTLRGGGGAGSKAGHQESILTLGATGVFIFNPATSFLGNYDPITCFETLGYTYQFNLPKDGLVHNDMLVLFNSNGSGASGFDLRAGSNSKRKRIQVDYTTGKLKILAADLSTELFSLDNYGMTKHKTSADTVYQDYLAGPFNCRLGNIAKCLEITANTTVAVPTNPTEGQRVTWRVLQDGTGGRTVTWNAIFKHAWSDAGNAANKQCTISFFYDGTNWVQIGAQSPYF